MNKSQVKESSQGGKREEEGNFHMRFEMRSRVDEAKTYGWLFWMMGAAEDIFRKREKLKGTGTLNNKSTTYSTKHCFKI